MLLVSIMVMLKCFNVYGFTCLNSTELYLKEGQIMQVRRNPYSPTYLEIETCRNTTRELVEFDPESVLKNISTFWLVAVPWPFEHETPQLQRVQMNDLTSYGVWGDCSNLNHMYVKQGSDFANSNDLTKIPPDWLTNCTNLRSLDLRNLSMAEIRSVVDSAPSLEKLILYHIKDIVIIPYYPLVLKNRPHQRLKDITLYDFTKYASLKGHNITWAEVSATLVWQLSLLPQLESLYIGDLNFDMCEPGYSSVNFGSLRTLRLQNTNTKRFCLKKYHSVKVHHVSIWASPLFDMQFSDLLSTPAQKLLVDFHSFGNIVNFGFTRDDYLTLSDLRTEDSAKGNVTLLGARKSIECDCDSESWWFARALQAQLVTANGITCTDDSSPADLACEWLPCDRISCDSTCICCREEQNSISVDCREANLTAFPTELLNLPNLTRLIAPNNNISTLPDHLPNTLLQTDLSGNNIWHAGANQVEALFTQPARRVRLARNYVLCSCDNKLLISQLQAHSHQIEDFENITCADTNTKLGDVNVLKLCETRERDAALLKNREATLASVLGTLVLAAAGIVLSVVLYYRRRQIQIFLFSRGWCLCCVSEKELDADRRYDIFISFCHADTKLVVEKMLPTLDSNYSVCFHLRDWCPGEMIPTQITWSVEQSRRTIVVMSRDFVRSLWGSLEFQTAHVSGLADGRPRVILVVVDDVLEKEQLSSEMRSYVRLNTYVRWDDPWFWEKLRYALPHRTSSLPASPGTPSISQQTVSGPRERYIEITETEWKKKAFP